MNGKTVIITGASSGIGKALAFETAKKGAQIVIAARREDRLIEIKNKLESQGHEVLYVKTDVSSETDCKNLIEKTIEKFGKIDILINNAGISMRASFNDLDLNVLRTVMGVNYWGTVYCTKYAMPWLLKSKGSVVAVSSITGYAGLPGRTGYASSKFAVHGFMESLRMENYKTNLHVMVVAPGFTESEVRMKALTADGSQQGETPKAEDKLMTAEEVAVRIVKAIKKRRNTLVMSFEGKISVALRKFAPRLLDLLTYNIMKKEPNSPF